MIVSVSHIAFTNHKLFNQGKGSVWPVFWARIFSLPHAMNALNFSPEPGIAGIMLYRLLVAMAIDAYGYDPDAPKQGQGVMKKIQGSLERQGWANKQDRIKDVLERAVLKSGRKPRQP